MAPVVGARTPVLGAKDDLVLELAVAAGCEGIVTYNLRDFAGAERFGVRIYPPREFLRLLEEVP